MRKTQLWIGGLVVTVALGWTAALVYSEEKAQRPDPGQQPTPEQIQQAMEMWAKLAAPGEHHQNLEPFVGQWKTRVKMFMGGPGSDPTISEGSSNVKWILGGRYIMEEFHSTLMGQPVEGLGITGYDNFRNMYQTIWMDTMSTTMLSAVGTVDHQTGKKFRFYGEMDEPGLNVVGRTYKSVLKVIDDDHHIMEMYDLHVSDDYKVMEIEYRRVK